MTFRVIDGGRSDLPAQGLLITGASEVVTMAGGLRMGSGQGDPAVIDSPDGPFAPTAAAVACWQGQIVGVGPRAELESRLADDHLPLSRFQRLDAQGGSVTPGLVDPHTHLLFAGTRESELLLRQAGAGYLEILATGGGILSTVAATRAASADALAAHGRTWLDTMLGHGTTTVAADAPWCSLDLELGDVIVFSALTVHCALPNVTADQLRVSVDYRYRPTR